jgi:multicomponent Na+:H+ antiporter subunit F
MDSVAFYPAAVLLLVLLALTGIRAVSSASTTARILAIDTAALEVIALLALFSYWQGVSYYLDAALVLALLAFVGTLGAARFHGEGRLY